MGCWNETCEITNMPILSGDPCYMVDFGSGFKPGLPLDRDRNLDVIRIVKGTYSDYGDLSEYPDDNYPGVEHPGPDRDYTMRPKYIRSDGIIPVYGRSFFDERAWDDIQQYVPEPEIMIYDRESKTNSSKSLSEVLTLLQEKEKKLAEWLKAKPALRAEEELSRYSLLHYDVSEIKYSLRRHGVMIDVDYVVEFTKVTQFLAANRMTLVGCAYAGSQDCDVDSPKKRIELIERRIQEIKADWDEE